MNTPTNFEEIPSHITLHLGQSIADRKLYVAAIKDAMATAIMNQIENDTMDSKGNDFMIYQTLYLEACNTEHVLSKL